MSATIIIPLVVFLTETVSDVVWRGFQPLDTHQINHIDVIGQLSPATSVYSRIIANPLHMLCDPKRTAALGFKPIDYGVKRYPDTAS